MHTAVIFIAASAFFASTWAAPLAARDAEPHPPSYAQRGRGVRPSKPKLPKCMSEQDALIVAVNFQQLIQGYTKEMALAALTEDFVDYSSAVSIIVNKGAAEPKDVTAPIFTSRDEFMQGHGKQKPIPFETLKVWHDCNGTVTMRWKTIRSGFGQPTEAAAIPVIGTAIIETVPAEDGNPYNYRIHTLYSEFNAAAWLVNLGIFVPEGPVTPVPASKRSVQSIEKRDTVQEWFDVGAL
ncbi:MAG: hypothetical protein FE78DRAFT_87977 [Acidomyces sp. 'richmondensis']|nr:MAG: hypothetical protein FE78DRAFT_87977 [Acidomyces sp. 'richmondensis']